MLGEVEIVDGDFREFVFGSADVQYGSVSSACENRLQFLGFHQTKLQICKGFIRYRGV